MLRIKRFLVKIAIFCVLGFMTMFVIMNQRIWPMAASTTDSPHSLVLEGEQLTLSILFPPKGMTPLGMADQSHGYLLDKADPSVLWYYDYDSEALSPLIDYRGSDLSIGDDIAFSSRWLVWMEIAPYQQQENDERERTVRLMARDLSAWPQTADIVIDCGSNAPAEGFSLPFDNLDLEGSSLVYRWSGFAHGNRDTQVRFFHLDEQKLSTLMSVSHTDQQQILRCSMSGSLLVWDVQTKYLHQMDPRLPPSLKAHYDIIYLPLHDGLLAPAESIRQLSEHGDYYAPVVYRDRVLALCQHDPEFLWTDAKTSSGDGPLVHLGGSHIVNRTFDTSIVAIKPTTMGGGSSAELVRDYDYARAVMEYYRLNAAPRSIQRDNLFVGQRFLSWQSNVNEQHVVFDMMHYAYVTLPLFFSGVYEDEHIVQIDMEILGEMQRQDFAYLPALNTIDVKPVPGLDADYLFFTKFDTDETYLLRIGE